jgi:hypothetical protein
MEQNNTTCDHVEKISLSRSLKVKVFEAFDTLTLSETLKMISLISAKMSASSRCMELRFRNLDVGN